MVCLTYHFFFVKALPGPKINIEITKGWDYSQLSI